MSASYVAGKDKDVDASAPSAKIHKIRITLSACDAAMACGGCKTDPGALLVQRRAT
jgi:hypothetical protein